MSHMNSEELSNTYLLNSLVKKSSVPAFSRVGQAEAKPQRIFWLSVLLMCLCGCGYETSRFLRTFFQYPVLIDVETENSVALDFPAVTVCNLNRVANYHSECIENNKTWSACPQVFVFVSGGNPTMSERKMYTAISKTTTQLEIKYKLKSQKFFDHYTHLDYADQKCYGYRLHQLVTNCSFNSVSCRAGDFSYFQSIQYGNCYTFNKASNDMESSRLAMREVGQDSGLDLELDTCLDTYLDFSASAGMRVIVHNADENPNPVDDGFNIVPGYETQVSLTKVSIQRLPAPYRDRCRDYKTSKGSQFDCIRECQQEMAREKCGCVDPFLRTDLQAILCNLRNKSQMSCLDDLLNNLEKAGLPCECPLSCIITTFEKKIGMAVIHPAEMHYPPSTLLISEEPECGSGPNSKKKRTPPNQRHNKRSHRGQTESKAKLKIFYGSLDHTKYTQRAMFSDSELYAHLGGHLGLWLGLSCIALFECVEYLALLFYLLVSKMKIRPK